MKSKILVFCKEKLKLFFTWKVKCKFNNLVKSVKVDNNKINNRMSPVQILEKDVSETVYESQKKKGKHLRLKLFSLFKF